MDKEKKVTKSEPTICGEINTKHTQEQKNRTRIKSKRKRTGGKTWARKQETKSQQHKEKQHRSETYPQSERKPRQKTVPKRENQKPKHKHKQQQYR